MQVGRGGEDEGDSGDRVRAEADRNRQVRAVVEVRDHGERGDEPGEQRLGPDERECEERAGDDTDPAEARDRSLVKRAFVRVVEGEPVAAFQQEDDDARASERCGDRDEREHGRIVPQRRFAR